MKTHIIDIEGVDVDFPFAKPYDGQIKMMKKVFIKII